ncbi:uncharacterized protein LOC114294228 [Camellia sinensis]|uniref:uncharacterized protein LOC114294228 n=1 Tax=Camellia sinensis TaxID=4442 RepID=UPI001035C042|nr:uncharacterized protein LOC114294228 [Camellia sinensis]
MTWAKLKLLGLYIQGVVLCQTGGLSDVAADTPGLESDMRDALTQTVDFDASGIFDNGQCEFVVVLDRFPNPTYRPKFEDVFQWSSGDHELVTQNERFFDVTHDNSNRHFYPNMQGATNHENVLEYISKNCDYTKWGEFRERGPCANQQNKENIYREALAADNKEQALEMDFIYSTIVVRSSICRNERFFDVTHDNSNRHFYPNMQGATNHENVLEYISKNCDYTKWGEFRERGRCTQDERFFNVTHDNSNRHFYPNMQGTTNHENVLEYISKHGDYTEWGEFRERGRYANQHNKENIYREALAGDNKEQALAMAHYSANLQSLIYDLAKEHLVNELRYPDSCLEFKYDPTFPIRGLYYDKLKGCLLKLDFFGSIEPDGCYFGQRKFTKNEIEQIYGTRHIGRDQAHGLVSLMDFFCFSEACLIADIVQHFVDAKLEFDAPYVYQDVNRAIQHVHGSGLAHRGILSDPQRYQVKDSQLQRFLRMLKENGKKLFLLTNSPYYFVDGGMRFMLEDSLGERDSWRELFDVVIAKANKPEFYTSENLFRCYDEEKDTLAFSKVDSFLPDRVYYHGCLKFFLQITKRNGPELIYFGDHLFSDLRGPSKAGWRTAAIIHELEVCLQFH